MHTPSPGTAPGWADIAEDLERLRRDGRWLPGPATVFEVLHAGRVERSHQRMIAWLLNPRAAHGLGDALLAAVLRDAAGEQEPAADLHEATVRLEIRGERSRADIVVSTPTVTLVIELKIDAPEGRRQTQRLAADHPNAVLVLLTLHPIPAPSPPFVALRLAALAEHLAHALDHTPPAASRHAVDGRNAARDYLATLRRMTGMTPVDQDAVRFWIEHGTAVRQAQRAARQVAQQVIEHLPSRMARLATELSTPEDDQVSCWSGTTGKTEAGVLLYRPAWGGPKPDTQAIRAGIGAAWYTTKAALEPERFVFYGVHCTDPAVHVHLTHQLNGKLHRAWAWWDWTDITLPASTDDLVEAYLDRIADDVRTTWERAVSLLAKPPGEGPDLLFRRDRDIPDL